MDAVPCTRPETRLPRLGSVSGTVSRGFTILLEHFRAAAGTLPCKQNVIYVTLGQFGILIISIRSRTRHQGRVEARRACPATASRRDRHASTARRPISTPCQDPAA